MTTENCFVMQPFDNGKFDKRYKDIFEPAIRECGLNPYRVDLDPSVRIPIEDIEKGIKNSKICFADITVDNPNVWYELGFAFACGKDVIMVCSNERNLTHLPFDIRHRDIIIYDNDSSSSFEKLKIDIIEKINAFLKRQATVASIKQTVLETEGLSDHEITALVIIMANNQFDFNTVAGFEIRNQMQKGGYTDIASSIAIKKLINKEMVQQCNLADDYGNEYIGFTILPKGEEWLLKNEDKLILNETSYELSEELPF